MLMFGQQLSGMNAVMFYCVDIFKVDFHKLTIADKHKLKLTFSKWKYKMYEV